eukprot:2797327-Pleurochrysis_carterae.AAC.1
MEPRLQLHVAKHQSINSTCLQWALLAYVVHWGLIDWCSWIAGELPTAAAVLGAQAFLAALRCVCYCTSVLHALRGRAAGATDTYLHCMTRARWVTIVYCIHGTLLAYVPLDARPRRHENKH